jgi:hypothetical protein
MNVNGMYFVTQSCRSSHESFEKTIRLPGRSGYCAASTTQYRLSAKIDIVNPHDRPSVEPDGSGCVHHGTKNGLWETNHQSEKLVTALDKKKATSVNQVSHGNWSHDREVSDTYSFKGLNKAKLPAAIPAAPFKFLQLPLQRFPYPPRRYPCHAMSEEDHCGHLKNRLYLRQPTQNERLVWGMIDKTSETLTTRISQNYKVS